MRSERRNSNLSAKPLSSPTEKPELLRTCGLMICTGFEFPSEAMMEGGLYRPLSSRENNRVRREQNGPQGRPGTSREDQNANRPAPSTGRPIVAANWSKTDHALVDAPSGDVRRGDRCLAGHDAPRALIQVNAMANNSDWSWAIAARTAKGQ